MTKLSNFLFKVALITQEVQKIVILGRIARWTEEGLEWEADPKHRRILMEQFAFDENSKSLEVNGEKEVWYK